MPEQSRIKEISPDEMTPEQRQLFNEVIAGRGYVLTPFKIWIHSPDVAAGMERLGASVTRGISLSRRESEIAICMIANHWKADYVWTNHVRQSVALGFAPEVFEAIHAGRRPALDDSRERAVYDLCVAAMAEDGGSDEAFDHAAKILGRRGIADVLAVIGYYGMVAMSLKLHRVPLLSDQELQKVLSVAKKST